MRGRRRTDILTLKMDENFHQEIFSEFEQEAEKCIKQEIVLDDIIATDEEDISSGDESVGLQKPENVNLGPRMFSISMYKDQVSKFTDLNSAFSILQELVPRRATNCSDCQRYFSNRDFLLKHLQKDHLSCTAGKYICPRLNCNKVYSKSGDLQKHISCIHNTSSDKIDMSSCSWDFVNDSEKKIILDDGIELVPDPDNPHEFTTKQTLKIRSCTNMELWRKFKIPELCRMGFADSESADSSPPPATLLIPGMENQITSVKIQSSFHPAHAGNKDRERTFVDIIKPRSTETSAAKNRKVSLLKTPQSSETEALDDCPASSIIIDNLGETVKTESVPGLRPCEKVKVPEPPAWKYGSGWKKEPGEVVRPAGWEFQKISRTSVWLEDESLTNLEDGTNSKDSKKMRVDPKTIKVHINKIGDSDDHNS